MYDKEYENDYVPLNFDELSKNPAVWEVIKEEMNYLSGDCLMKIITAAKEEGLKDDKIFIPTVEVVEVEVEFEDIFKSSINDTTEED
jgi:hypothetical protein